MPLLSVSYSNFSLFITIFFVFHHTHMTIFNSAPNPSARNRGLCNVQSDPWRHAAWFRKQNLIQNDKATKIKNKYRWRVDALLNVVRPPPPLSADSAVISFLSLSLSQLLCQHGEGNGANTNDSKRSLVFFSSFETFREPRNRLQGSLKV